MEGQAVAVGVRPSPHLHLLRRAVEVTAVLVQHGHGARRQPDEGQQAVLDARRAAPRPSAPPRCRCRAPPSPCPTGRASSAARGTAGSPRS